MSQSTDAPEMPKSRFDVFAIWLAALSGGASAMWASYLEISEALRQGKWVTLPYWFFAYACLIFAAWIWDRRARAERDYFRAAVAAAADGRRVRESIGQLLANGSELIVLINRAHQLPIVEAQAWMDNAAAEIGRLLDSSYVARFHSAAGSGPVDREPSPKNLLLAAIRFRLKRLNEFLAELAPRFAR